MSRVPRSQLNNLYTHVEESQSPITVEEVMALVGSPVRELPEAPVPVRRKPRFWVAVAAAAVVLVLLGVLPLLFTTSEEDTPPATELPSTVTTSADTSAQLPGVALGEVPAFQATVRYTYGDSGGSAYDDGAMIDVRVSYDPPDSFRRDVVAYEPDVMQIRFGEVGSRVAVNGSVPDLTYETLEEGEALGPLVWSNWQDACAHAPVVVATEDTGSVLLTVVECDSADSQWVRAGTPWRVKVDAVTGVVFDVEAELREGGEFRIPAESVEILNIEYSPEYIEAYFVNPNPPPPSLFPAEPIAYTIRLGGSVEFAFSLLDADTWRNDVIVGVGGDDSIPGTGSYAIKRGSEYLYNADTNQYSENARSPMSWYNLLVWYSCDDSGTCRWFDDPEGQGLTCEMSDGGAVAGRLTTRYHCEATTSDTEDITLWTDNESGFLLKHFIDGEIFFEVLTIDLKPTFPLGLFDKKCPTPDCTLAPEPTE